MSLWCGTHQEQRAATVDALAEHTPVLLALLAELISSPMGKPQRQGEAHKAACALVEAMSRLQPSIASQPDVKDLLQAAQKALRGDAASSGSKVWH